MATKIFCDVCNKEIANYSTYSHDGHCNECGMYGQKNYHKECLIEIELGRRVCSEHEQRYQNDKMISNYVKKLWNDIGFDGTANTRGMNATIGPINLSISLKYDHDAKSLSSILLEVNGLAQGTREFSANLFDHKATVQQIRSAVIRSLRSTKSSISIEKKRLDERISKIDNVINGLKLKFVVDDEEKDEPENTPKENTPKENPEES